VAEFHATTWEYYAQDVVADVNDYVMVDYRDGDFGEDKTA
jgi:hypothetical protein